ncbi:hypothetical protein RUND412_004929 [Rhizina undulata]
MTILEEEQIANSIIDIRSSQHQETSHQDIVNCLNAAPGERSFPTYLLYDTRGLQLYEDIIMNDDAYYLIESEVDILTKWAEKMADNIPHGGMVVELGSGCLRKTEILLAALNRQRKNINYYALDLSFDEIHRSLRVLPKYEFVHTFGLHGTYEDGLGWLSQPEQRAKKGKCILWLGSSLGNFERSDAAKFLTSMGEALEPEDMAIIAMDGCKDGERVRYAYSHHGPWALNGLKSANNLLGKEVFVESDWTTIGEWDEDISRHRSNFLCLKDSAPGALGGFKQGEKFGYAQSNKYTPEEAGRLFKVAGLQEVSRWGNQRGDYHLYMINLQV